MSRFGWLYLLIGFFLVVTWAAALVGVAQRPRAPDLPPIRNSSYPNTVDQHFTGKPYATIPASSVGLRDGTCYVYSNRVSWAVFECFGAVVQG